MFAVDFPVPSALLHLVPNDQSTCLLSVVRLAAIAAQDVRKYDSPIVYASPTFSELTGYEAKEIIGKNCRFLQGTKFWDWLFRFVCVARGLLRNGVLITLVRLAPNGEVQKGSRRKFTDNIAVAHLQRQLAQGKECQASLINYKKGGVPFINLVTVVPIPWDTEEIMFHVGFQVCAHAACVGEISTARFG